MQGPDRDQRWWKAYGTGCVQHIVPAQTANRFRIREEGGVDWYYSAARTYNKARHAEHLLLCSQLLNSLKTSVHSARKPAHQRAERRLSQETLAAKATVLYGGSGGYRHLIHNTHISTDGRSSKDSTLPTRKDNYTIAASVSKSIKQKANAKESRNQCLVVSQRFLSPIPSFPPTPPARPLQAVESTIRPSAPLTRSSKVPHMARSAVPGELDWRHAGSGDVSTSCRLLVGIDIWC